MQTYQDYAIKEGPLKVNEIKTMQNEQFFVFFVCFVGYKIISEN